MLRKTARLSRLDWRMRAIKSEAGMMFDVANSLTAVTFSATPGRSSFAAFRVFRG
jgi:hypothetical protein